VRADGGPPELQRSHDQAPKKTKPKGATRQTSRKTRQSASAQRSTRAFLDHRITLYHHARIIAMLRMPRCTDRSDMDVTAFAPAFGSAGFRAGVIRKNSDSNLVSEQRTKTSLPHQNIKSFVCGADPRGLCYSEGNSRHGRGAGTKMSIEDEIAHLLAVSISGITARWQSVFSTSAASLRLNAAIYCFAGHCLSIQSRPSLWRSSITNHAQCCDRPALLQGTGPRCHARLAPSTRSERSYSGTVLSGG